MRPQAVSTPGGFDWSVTIYANDNRLMAHNALNRHSRGDRTLKPDSEGYYTIIMSSNAEGKMDVDNYLPIPKKSFYAILRMYGPGEEIQSGNYEMPPVKKATK